MADDKPKHKPQAKRTLEEVLRSLKDLVRNDLTGERVGSSAPAATSRPVASEEPESFNEALSRLDAIIDEQIIKPAHATPPPAPRTTADEIDIDWNDVAEPNDADTDARARSATAPSDPPSHAAGTDLGLPALDEVAADGEYRMEDGSGGDADLPGADASDLAALEAIELAPIAPEEPPRNGATEEREPRDHATASQETFNFLELEGHPRGSDEAPAPDQSPHVANDAQAAGAQIDTDRPAPAPVASGHERATGDAGGLQMLEAAPMPGDSHDHAMFETDPPGPRQAAMSADASDEGRTVRRPGAGTDNADAGSGNARVSAAPDRGRDTVPSGAAEPPTLEEEIPVLQDVAPGRAAASAFLPDAAHARDIAIRVIARINIERRKSGETPLDIRTIERLQRYLTEALTKAAAGRAK